jgi:hypothetical protein
LSDLKRKSDKNTSKIEMKGKEKSMFGQNYLFVKKQAHHYQRSVNSSSKNSGKSISIRRKKGMETP